MNPFSIQMPLPSDYRGFPEEWVEQSVGEVFQRQVQAFANREAVVTADRTLSYAQLNQTVNRVAGAILSECPDRPMADVETATAGEMEAHAEPVAVFLEQGIDAIIAILGLLKAGKLLLFMDPDDPHTRNRHLLNHAPARIIITDQKHLEMARQLAPKEVAILRIDSGVESGCSEVPLQLIAPAAPACLVYTSGSTGCPKGIMHTHRTVLHDIAVKTSLMAICPGDRIALLAWGTGQALKVVLSALLNGATLCPYNLKQLGVGRLSNWLRDHRITFLTMSSPVFRVFTEAVSADEVFPDVRVVRLASDTVYPHDIARCRDRFPNASVLSALSSNETGTIAGMVLDAGPVSRLERVPIGLPVPGMEVILRNDDGTAATEGTPGVLTVSSRTIARGYWRDPLRTKEAFSIDPDDPGRIVFRSGDLAEWGRGGLLYLCGRRDFQVKIRGYRVDLQEAEAALVEHPDIMEAVVQPFEDGSGNKRLVAYMVPRTRPAPTSSALIRFLKDRVTDYMIPATFIHLDKIPLLANGKTNRRALPEPGRDRPDLDSAYVAPRTGIEQQLVEIWSTVIGIEAVGIHDPFMELGGDSLRAGQVMARVLEVFGVDLPLPVLFECPTVAEFAAVIEAKGSGAEGKRSGRPAIRRHPGPGPWPLSFGQQRLWFLDQFDPDSTAYNMPKLIRLAGSLNVEALAESLEWVVRRHEVLRTHYLSREGVPEAVVAEKGPFGLPVVDLSHVGAGDRSPILDHHVAEESARRFDLERDLKLRAVLYRFAPEDHVLLCITHHIASDGWSRGILLRELASHYACIVHGEGPQLPELPIQYSDFARWQLEHSRSESVSRQLDWWKHVLAPEPKPLDLPADRVRPKRLSSRGAACIVWITRNRSDALVELARDEHVTLFMLMMAAFNVMIYRYTQRKDLVVGFPVAGRSAVETEDLIGFFVNSLILRSDLGGNPTFREFLAQVRERALGAYANPDVPFEQLVNELRIPRDPSRNPLFQVMFDVHRLRSSRIKSGEAVFELMDSKRESTVVDQVWNIALADNGLRVRIEYNTDLFEEPTVKRMADAYCRLLNAILEDPEARLDTLAFGEDRRRTADGQVAAVIAEIWESLLGEPPADDNADFFNSGGHSLYAMRFVANLRSRLGTQVSIREFFDHSSFMSLVELVESKQRQEGD